MRNSLLFRRNYLGKMVRRLMRYLGLACKSPRDIEPFRTRGVESFQAHQIVRAALLGNQTLNIDEPRFFSSGTFQNTKFVFEQVSVTFHHCKFIGCSFSFPHGFITIHFFKSELEDCFFEDPSHSHLGFQRSEFRRVRFANPFSVNGIRMRTTKGLETCIGLETMVIQNSAAKRSFERDLAATPLPINYKLLSWSNIRGFGKLPFFGFSYGGTAFLLFLLSFIDMYNTQIRNFWSWSDAHNTSEPFVRLASRLIPISLSYHILVLLFASVVLMIASTIYAVKCPDRVKESSFERWTKELGHGSNSYAPLTWRSPFWRLLCGAFFVIGSIATAIVMLLRVTEGVSQALRNL